MKMAVPYNMLLHPELLTNEQLLQIIQERHLRIDNLETYERYDLLDIFHQYCVPYGQRKERDRGRGKVPTPVLVADSRESLDTVNNNVNKRKFINSNCDKLKPPSDLSGQMKRIKLECTAAATLININKRKMSIDSVQSEVPPTKKERKPITWP